MGFFTLAIGGLGFIFIGAWQAFTFSTPKPNQISLPSSPLTHSSSKPSPSPSSSSSSSLSFLCISVFSFLFILNSLFSFIDALKSRDRVGTALQLQVLAIAALFLLYGVAGLLVNSANSFSLPSSLLDSILLFAFIEEFLLYYLQRKDQSGIENQYFDLLLVPIAVCVISTILDLKSPQNSNFPKFFRGVGLILHGMWFVQMGLSFYTNLISHGCSLHEKSRGNYSVKCKGHPEYHRARSIATLQFNCHLALFVVLVSFMYSLISRRYGSNGEFMPYRPLVEEMQPFENQNQFTLDSDEDDVGEEGIREEQNVVSKQKASIVEHGLNGHASHQ
ncbi:hypothetical protein L484_000467 [Morus notabilis]|uniref:Transmembrane protein 45B n=1 Tax=Morus notabilis TaxID=981085 RepID=W9SDD1_9ROSA|nr:uncharacterized protein LOC21384102 [Morus notabilis]EXC35734.1 hypothetical protein L484_000467 [Morus notabilis]